MDKVPDNIDAIVIGSGMSGMTTAAVLARSGKKVLVLEQHYIAGGGCHMFDLEGYHFDSGLHYVVPWCQSLLHATCGGAEPPVQFDLLREKGSDVFDRIVLGDRPPFLIKHQEAHLPELYKMFPENEKEIKNYLKVSEDAMKSLPLFALSRLFPQWVQKIIGNLFLGTFRKYAGKSGKEVLQGITKNKHLASLLGGLWIDTGGLPDRSTFLLSAAVFRGLPHEGGAYPRGGSQKIIDSMIPVIEQNGGKVLMRAMVEEILVDPSALKVTGVRVNGREIKAPMVISSCGYPTTFQKLVPESITQKAGIKREIPVEASPGFLMCNVGIRGKPEDMGVECSNVWYHPTVDDDIYQPIEDFFDKDSSLPFGVMITFPSMKDRSWEEQHPDQITCQMLVVTNYDWFKNYSEQPSGRREEEYKAMKKGWENRCLELLYRFFPKVKGHIEVVDVSTPLTIEYYLNEPKGGAVGLNPSPERYSDWELVKDLDIVTPINNLFMTGQDTLVCGQPCVQIAGLITALRILGPLQTFSFISEGLKIALAYFGAN
eukprot:CAMPEP_0201522318 /NCGR_PEP_ID=MMETSP0161_2-20130828/16913_1 /ASSEMBLY_ACC=CAM_ASM_000251 /TAXON_ID=180227 /ORGANISM="Neoparamoeba aestuarina, Strain SoJaBio B1-5/56/2" /LENGTH=541 /DNA_ID=CAMNT_0047921129 /DNA_START=202 /DNA_END=1827 /DNA_ORIENTATION=+